MRAKPYPLRGKSRWDKAVHEPCRGKADGESLFRFSLILGDVGPTGYDTSAQRTEKPYLTPGSEAFTLLRHNRKL